MRILYVEDNPANLFLVRRVAKMGGHEVINYIDGEDALANFGSDKPDLVLMDIQLAGELSGLDVIQRLRDRGHHTPIIAVTAYAMVGDRERFLAAGCDDYLAKPLPIPRLVEILEHYSTAHPVMENVQTRKIDPPVVHLPIPGLTAPDDLPDTEPGPPAQRPTTPGIVTPGAAAEAPKPVQPGTVELDPAAQRATVIAPVVTNSVVTDSVVTAPDAAEPAPDLELTPLAEDDSRQDTEMMPRVSVTLQPEAKQAAEPSAEGTRPGSDTLTRPDQV